jgi:hypothetical protein
VNTRLPRGYYTLRDVTHLSEVHLCLSLRTPGSAIIASPNKGKGKGLRTSRYCVNTLLAPSSRYASATEEQDLRP